MGHSNPAWQHPNTGTLSLLRLAYSSTSDTNLASISTLKGLYRSKGKKTMWKLWFDGHCLRVRFVAGSRTSGDSPAAQYSVSYVTLLPWATSDMRRCVISQHTRWYDERCCEYALTSPCYCWAKAWQKGGNEKILH